MIEYCGTALALTAVKDMSLIGKMQGELARHACRLIQLRGLTPYQKEIGISAYQEQTGKEPEWSLRDTPRWGSLVYGYIKKEDREHKLTERAFRGCLLDGILR